MNLHEQKEAILDRIRQQMHCGVISYDLVAEYGSLSFQIKEQENPLRMEIAA